MVQVWFNWNMPNTPIFKVGDPIYVVHPGSWNVSYHKSVIAKVTPSGMIDVGTGDYITRYGTNGYEMGSASSRHRRKYLDVALTVEQRDAALAQEQRANVAAGKIREISGSERVLGTWGKENLMKEVERLEVLLRNARETVEAI